MSIRFGNVIFVTSLLKTNYIYSLTGTYKEASERKEQENSCQSESAQNYILSEKNKGDLRSQGSKRLASKKRDDTRIAEHESLKIKDLNTSAAGPEDDNLYTSSNESHVFLKNVPESMISSGEKLQNCCEVTFSSDVVGQYTITHFHVT